MASIYPYVAKLAKRVLPERLVSFIVFFKLKRKYKSNKFCHELKNKKIYSWQEFNKTILKKNRRPVIIHQKCIPWFTPLYQRPQHMATSFSKLGCLSLYITEEVPYGFIKLNDNLWLASILDSEKIENAFRIFYSTVTDLKFWFDRCPKNSKFIYEYIDHIDAKISSTATDNLTEGLRFAISGGFHKILASSNVLIDELKSKGVPENKLVFVPNGVNTEDFRKANYIPEINQKNSFMKFRANYPKIVGYFGALAPWLDYKLINEIVSRRKDLGFVFIGPDYLGGQAQLQNAKNLLCLGSVKYKELPFFSLQFNVAWIPFEEGDIAKSTSPLKLYEYFAMEKPVVVTKDLLECTCYNEVFVTDENNPLTEVLDRALNIADNSDYKVKLRRLADKNDWLVRAEHYLNNL